MTYHFVSWSGKAAFASTRKEVDGSAFHETTSSFQAIPESISGEVRTVSPAFSPGVFSNDLNSEKPTNRRPLLMSFGRLIETRPASRGAIETAKIAILMT